MTAVDVMLPYYGDVEQMKAAARSVMAQHFKDWRLHVFDDGYPSPEPEQFFAGIDDPRVSYQKNEQNLGANGNYRKALAQAQAPFVVIMGADDIMLPNYLDVVVRSFEAHAQAVIVQPGVQVIDENGSAVMPLVDRVKKACAPRSVTPVVLSHEQLAASLLRANWTYFPSLAWRTETVQQIGFTEGLDVVQDLAMLLDVADRGGELVVDPELAFLYRRHSASDSSVRALDGRRFEEERRFFQRQSERFRARGWEKAARAANMHLMSRLNAGSLVFKALSSGQGASVQKLLKHVVG
ncbi:glycosyltransferase family A protein [Sinomonas sp. ASV486]|uniref:glycosyltransferase family 2 protein n=1 Tax=Sinomonas sp. ASV486 TaxID=3051170 RepID=UPI0027DE7D8C|nr:glycosyltransferase family A protein [Sinomonas sp. ASV486]MDQ4490979.1 glycosyltransferase family A protein [Sinomonas sp. ASV486]